MTSSGEDRGNVAGGASSGAVGLPPAGLPPAEGSVAASDAVPAAPPPTLAVAAAQPADPPSAPIVHFSAAAPPIVCCVAMHIDSGADDLQRNVERLGVVQGGNFWYFC